jgi:PPOX class probable F420-dependent enzyme
VEEARGDAGVNVLDAVRHRSAAGAARSHATTGGLDPLRGHKYALLVTFKRSGEPVPTPVWFGLGDDGHAYTRSEATAWKVKRIARDPHVRIGPCDARGRPRGELIEARARVLGPDHAVAERAIASNYGLGRRLYSTFVSRFANGLTYIEIAPVDGADEEGA